MAGEREKYPEALIGLRDDLIELLVLQGVDHDLAKNIAHDSVEILRERWGGMYLPKGKSVDLCRRDREIGRRWNGGNKAALCQEYDITEQRLYQILAKLRAEHVAARQMRIF